MLYAPVGDLSFKLWEVMRAAQANILHPSTPC